MSAEPDPGFLGNTTPEQDAARKELAERLSAVLQAPGGQVFLEKFGGLEVAMLRMLRARKFDVSAAVTLVEEILVYRREHVLDPVLQRIIGDQALQDPSNPSWKPEITDESILRVLPHLPCGRHGFTRVGQPIEIWRISKLRPADLLKVDSEDLWNWWHFHLESGIKAVLDGAAHASAPVKGSILLFDLKGFGARHLNRQCLSVLGSLFGVGQSKYPESTSKIFIVNAPSLFSGAWAIIKTVLEDRTRNKIIITNKGYHEALSALVPDDVMPQFLGGKCVCTIGEKMTLSGASFTEVHIKARGDFKVAVEVQEGGYVGWEFFTDTKDIKFGVVRFAPGHYKEGMAMSTGEAVREIAKSTEKGEVQADNLEYLKAGTYVLFWDNSYSMMTGKALKYMYETGNASEPPSPMTRHA